MNTIVKEQMKNNIIKTKMTMNCMIQKIIFMKHIIKNKKNKREQYK